MLQHGLGIRFLSAWTCDFFLPVGIIAYAKTFFNMLFILFFSLCINQELHTIIQIFQKQITAFLFKLIRTLFYPVI